MSGRQPSRPAAPLSQAFSNYMFRNMGRPSYRNRINVRSGKMKTLVRKAIEGDKEWGHHNFTTSGLQQVLSGGTLIYQVTAINQGDDFDERIGRKIRLKNFNYRMDVRLSGTTPCTGRYIIFKWNDDTAPTAQKVLQNDNYLSNYDLDTSDKYKIIKDKFFTLNPNGSEQKVLKGVERFNHVVKFDGTADTNIEKGHIYIMFLSSNSTTGQAYNVECRGRCRFIDMA